jgi:hypothetical protein
MLQLSSEGGWQMGHLPLNIVISLLEQIRSTVTHANAPPANKQGL